jgi:ubiquinone/menaquinone biosynthesis C-methylase UbiE
LQDDFVILQFTNPGNILQLLPSDKASFERLRATIDMKDSWKYGDPYEYFMGRWSSLVAQGFLDWLSPGHGLKWLDVGCGSGALSEAAIHGFEPESLIAIDQSEAFVLTAQRRLGSKAICKIGNAVDLPIEDCSVELTVSGLVLNFVPVVCKALAEMKRVTADGGTVAIYVWDYAGTMDFLQRFWEAAAELREEVSALSEAKRFSDCNSEALMIMFREAGFDQVAAAPIEINTHFADFDDYWKPFLGGQGPAPTYLMSLSEAEREHLRNLIHERLPIQRNGSIPLSARAWAVKGIVAE